ncbi:MAG TPA: glycosyltransferase [Candidatus Limnocylindrales bacterium]|nr:glycosyltransferase [Candidatus Limnocylindrales bacterium]
MRQLTRTDYAAKLQPPRSYIEMHDYAVLVPRRLFQTAPISIGKPETMPPKVSQKKQLALLIAGHNEELVIEQTLLSAINAGMDPADIYVVDDNSSDATKNIAASVIGSDNVLRVKRSGKGLALTKGAKKFKLTQRYEWIHIADADGGFASNYFDIFRSKLDPKYAAATGYVRSLPGGAVSQYRVYEYTIGMEIHRRFQALTHTVSVIPGPTSCFRSDVFAKVNFANESLTEDFDITLQIHRQKLGHIQFIPQAVAYTQDPLTVQDFRKQITRWNHGIMQGLHRHQVGRRFSRVDAYLSYQVMQNFLLLFNYCFILPYLAITRQSLEVLAVSFLLDVLVLFALLLLVAARAGRKDILTAFPQIYWYRWITLYVFVKAFVEVMVLRKFLVTKGVWGTAGRRYKMPVAA